MIAGYHQMGHWEEHLPGGGGIAFFQYIRVAAPETLPAAPAVAASSHTSHMPAPQSPSAVPELPKHDSYPQGMLSAAASTISMADFGSASTGSLNSDDMDMSDARSDASDRTNLGGSWLLLDTASPTASGCSTPSCKITSSPPQLCPPSLHQPCPPPTQTSPNPSPDSDFESAVEVITPTPPAPEAFNRVLKKFSAEVIPSGCVAAIDGYMADKIAAQGLEDPVWVVDLGAVQRLYQAWTEAMPRVRPFYAAKCNMDPGLLAALSSLGAGFDCASEVTALP